MTVPLRFDQLDPTRQQAIQANVATMRAAGAPDSDIETYLSQHEHLAPVSAPSAPVHDFHAEYRSGQLARRMAAENSQDQAEAGGGLGTQVLGTLASLVRDIPGAEVLQSGASALLNHTSYSDARRQIRNAEDASVLETPARLVGGGIAAAALPSSMSPAMQGAAYGAASGALQSDPNAGVGKRAGDAAVGGAVGAITGKLTENLTNAVRSLASKRLGQQALINDAITSAADEANYGKVAAEARLAGGTSPEVQRMLAHPSPTLAPYVKEVNASESLQGADDATRLIEAYKLMSERQGMLTRRIIQAPPTDFKAGSSLERRDIGAVKGALQDAATASGQVTKPPLTMDVPAETRVVEPTIIPGRDALMGAPDSGAGVNGGTLADYTMGSAPIPGARPRQGPSGPAFQLRAQPDVVKPGVTIQTPGMRVQTAPAETVQYPAVTPSLPYAISEHARLSGLQNANESGSDAALRAIEERHIAAPKQLTLSADAFLNMAKNDVPWAAGGIKRGMTPEEAQQALAGILGRNKEFVGASVNPRQWFDGSSAQIAPFVRALDQQSGGAPLGVSLLRSLLTSQGHPNP